MSHTPGKIEKVQNFTTIDECLNKVSNRFELAVLLAKRSAEIDNTSDSSRKSILTAIEDIKTGRLDTNQMKEKIITSMQRNKNILHNTDLLNDIDSKSDETDILDEQMQDDYLIDNEHDFSLSEEEMDLLDQDDEVGFKR